MNCEQSVQLLHPYLDDELDLVSAMQIQNHLRECLQCREKLDAVRIVQGAARNASLYHAAPVGIRERMMQAIRAAAQAGAAVEKLSAPPAPTAAKSRWTAPRALSGIAAALILGIGSIILFTSQPASRPEVAEVIAGHVRSMEASHLLDVESTDQHTVKPWFAGKLDFSPPVIDLSAEGFPLIGGRLDYLQQQKVAALVYHHNKHVINLFIWPGSGAPESSDAQGFNLIRFETRGMNCWAISDLNAAELQQFVDLFKAQKPASTRF